jgi:hypothetical protein
MAEHRQIETEQPEDGADQALGLAQRQAEHGTERQSRGNRQVGVARLTTPAGAWLSAPRLDRLGRESHGQAAAGAQARSVRRPVGDPVALFGYVVATVPMALNGMAGAPQ